MLPEREETARRAEEMDDVVSFVLYRAGWPGKYQTLMEDAIVTGTGVAQVFWDEDMEDGEGMVNVLAWHPEDFYPDPMYEDMQDGRGCFKATRTSVAWVEQHYPQAKGYVTGDEYAKEEADDRHSGTSNTTRRRSGRTFTWLRSRGGRCCSARKRVTARSGRIPRGCMRTENIRSCSTNTATRGESRSARG